MIRTLIEVTGENDSEFQRNLHEALHQLGYQPKPDIEHTEFMADLRAALNDRGLLPAALVEEYRAKHPPVIRDRL